MTEPTLRTGTPDDFLRMVAHFDLVFGEAPNEEGLDTFKQWLEFDRVILAEDGPTLVGSAGAISSRMTVPGGATVPAGGLTIVAVRPTHRRSGLLRRMMRRHLEDVRDRGEATSMLYASESSIYGRFGFGSAAPSGEVSLARGHGAFRRDIPAARGTYRLLDLAEGGPIMRLVLPRTTAGVPGALVLREQDWTRRLVDYPSRREGHTPWRILVYERDGEPQGYSRYRQKEGWGDGGPEGKVAVRDVEALDGEAFAALWRFLLDLDLAVTLTAIPRPVPDPLRLLLADPRRLMEKPSDGLWLRPIDVPALLSARRYRVAGSVVIEVRDDFFESGGRYRLEGGPDGASCVRTDAAPDLSLGVEHLGAAYLGGQSLAQLAWVGLVAGDRDAIGRADDMFSWPVTPFNSLHF
jgi:predicted acetyltransferase